MTIDPNTGAIQWTPADFGTYPVTIEVQDTLGQSATQSYTLTIAPLPAPLPPVITTVPVTGATFTVPYGWSLSMSNTKVQIKHQDPSLSDFGDYVPMKNGDRVVITLPDGTKNSFTFEAQPDQGFGGPAANIAVFDWVPFFIPDADARGDQLLVNTVELQQVGNEFVNEATGDSYNPALPEFGNNYTLQMQNGTQLIINATTGRLFWIAAGAAGFFLAMVGDAFAGFDPHPLHGLLFGLPLAILVGTAAYSARQRQRGWLVLAIIVIGNGRRLDCYFCNGELRRRQGPDSAVLTIDTRHTHYPQVDHAVYLVSSLSSATSADVRR